MKKWVRQAHTLEMTGRYDVESLDGERPKEVGMMVSLWYSVSDRLQYC